jgi:transposase
LLSKQTLIGKKYGLSMKRILEKLYYQDYLSYSKIAKFLGVDDKTVRTWAKQAGIKSRSLKEALEYLDRTSASLTLEHLSLCVCPECKMQKMCTRSKVWHEKGFCVMACVGGNH